MTNLNFKNAIQRIEQPTPPIWMMRQAGRYHSHYRKLREKHSFMELCKVPELAAEVAYGPMAEFDFDVSILFSDLLFPLEALGFGLEYTDEGPRLGFSFTPDRFRELNPVDVAIEKLRFQAQALKLTRERIGKNKSLIGFVGGVFTLFVYAIEGGHAGQLINTKKLLRQSENFLERLHALLVQNVKLQLDAGAEVVMVFDTAAGELSPLDFQTYVQPWLAKLAHEFPNRLGYYSKGTQSSFFDSNLWREIPWAGQGYDHRWNLAKEMSRGLGSRGFIQGNFDQSLLHLEPSEFRKTLLTYLEPYLRLSSLERKGWVCALGHGVLPKTPEQNVKYFVEFVRKTFV